MKKVQIHFLNREGAQLKVAIIESAATGNDIQLEGHGERVKINNMNGVFHPLIPTKRIKDVQDGTMIELFSSRINYNSSINAKITKRGYVCQKTYISSLSFIN